MFAFLLSYSILVSVLLVLLCTTGFKKQHQQQQQNQQNQQHHQQEEEEEDQQNEDQFEGQEQQQEQQYVYADRVTALAAVKRAARLAGYNRLNNIRGTEASALAETAAEVLKLDANICASISQFDDNQLANKLKRNVVALVIRMQYLVQKANEREQQQQEQEEEEGREEEEQREEQQGDY